MIHEHSRYSIVEPIATGDYASVYRGRDLELDRDVAIKQIHEQFLHDPQQLEKYWQEARLIANLQYPRIMQIYDIVRERGWLILELMLGSIPHFLQGKPIDLKDLRIMLTSVACALKFLEENGIVHGDVKPSNILVDRNRLFKLGDFGIARRLAGDEGSVVKGTTKYMAPEVVSDQFGPVGPHSDLYSLGFTAYALMCGDRFESLFPGLNTFGRDRQIGWMMWHSASDRRLPKIERVFENVPRDLGRIVDRLCEKDPAKRYSTASEVLEDLREQASSAPEPESGKGADREGELGTGRRKRWLAVGAFAVSLLLSAGMLAIPPSKPIPESGDPKVEAPRNVRGQIVNFDWANRRIVFKDQNSKLGVIAFDDSADVIVVNGNQLIDFKELEEGDSIEVTTKDHPDGSKSRLFEVTRATAERVRGLLREVRPTSSEILVDPSDASREPFWVFVPDDLKIAFNGQAGSGVRPRVTVRELQAGDQIDVECRPPAGDREDPLAVSLRVLRTIQASGTLQALDPPAATLTLETREQTQVLPVAADCVITINGSAVDSNGSPYALADLRPGEPVSLAFDESVRRLDQQHRQKITGIFSEFRESDRQLEVTADGDRTIPLTLAENCRVELADVPGQEIEPGILRVGDKITVTADYTGTQALAVQAELEKDHLTWALVIACGQYRDPRVTESPTARQDADLIGETLQRFYRVPSGQFGIVWNATRNTLQRGVEDFVREVPAEGQLMVFFFGNAYLGKNGLPYLAGYDFDLSAPEKVGLDLRWLLQQLYESKAAERMLVLDSYQEGFGGDRRWQASSAALLRALNGTRVMGSRPVQIIASCDDNQPKLNTADGKHGLFAFHCADAFRGAADRNRDHRVNTSELYDFLHRHMAATVPPEGPKQKPVILEWSPPPAVSQETVELFRELLELLRRRHPLDARFEESVLDAKVEAADQPYPSLFYGLALLKEDKPLSRACEQFELAIELDEDCVVARHALAWVELRTDRETEGLQLLADAFSRLDGHSSEYAQHLIEFAAQMSAFAVHSVGAISSDDLRQHALTRAIARRGSEAKQIYLAPYEQTLNRIRQMQQESEQAAEGGDQVRAGLLKVNLKNPGTFAEFRFDLAEDRLRAELQELEP